MKILVIHNKYQTNNIGGEDIVYENELMSLRDKLGEKNVFSYEVSNNNLKKIKILYSIWFSRFHYKNVKKIIKDNEIDIVHIHNFYPLLTPSVFKAGKNSGATVIHTLHNYRLWCISGIFYRDKHGVCELCTKNRYSMQGILNKCFRKSLVQSILAQLSFWFYDFTKAYNNIDYFFVLTNFQKNKVISLGLNKERVLLKPNCLNINFEYLTEKKGYIFVGRLEESKGIYEVLKVWDKLDDRFVLTVIGGGDIEKELREKYFKKNIIFKGKCSRSETLKSISQSKYLIQSSILYETFGLTIIEAMSLSTPVIGFDIGTRSELIQDGVNGFLSDEDSLFEVIVKSFETKNYEFLRKNSIDTAKFYENNYVIDKQIKIYKNILDQKVRLKF